MQTITYKTVGNLRLLLDVIVPPNAVQAPVLLWFHGGGLLQGRRDTNIPRHLINGIKRYNYALVSADYRLAPQVGIEDIFQDVQDCVYFIRTELALHIGIKLLDTNRLAVSGSSAGGYLALLAGLYIKPKPSVILCMYPITDPLGKFFTTRRTNINVPGGRSDHLLVAEFLDLQADAVANNAPGDESNRNKLYNYMLEKGNLASLLQILDESQDCFRISKNVLAHGLPPTYIVHPDADEDVGIDQTDELVGVMVGLKLEVCYNRLHNLSHFFDLAENVELEDMYEFFLKYV